MQFKYNYFGFMEPVNIYLCKTDNTMICELNGIDRTTVSYTKQINNFSTLQFNIHKYINGLESNGYDLIDEAMYLFVDNIGYFRIVYPETVNDGFDEYKSVTAYSCEYELSLKNLVDFKINCGTNDSQEYLIEENVYETDEGVKIAKDHIQLYCDPNSSYEQLQKSKEYSLLDLAISKVKGWSIKYVDNTLAIVEVTKTTTLEDADGNITTKTYTVTEAPKRSFEIDSKSVYSFLTQDVSKKFECVFEFDIINRTISVYDVNTYGKDTGVIVSQRNLIQTLNKKVAQDDNIYTRFNVRGGDDLTIDSVNFGTSTIENLSYYLTEKHVSSDLIRKYGLWLTDYSNKREEYIVQSKQYNALMEKRNEINYRVPNDGFKTNWKGFTIDELKKVQKKYKLYRDKLKELYFDTVNNVWTSRGAYSDYISYGYDSEDTDLSTEENPNSGILGCIEETIKYKNNVLDDGKNIDDELEKWETQWDLYGLTELKNKLKTYTENKETLSDYKKSWKDLQNTYVKEKNLTEESYNIAHERYLKYVAWEKDCQEAIDTRQTEYTNIQKKMDLVSKEMSSISDSIDKSIWVSSDNEKFTDEELITLSKFYNDTDYTNDNILSVSTDTANQTIDHQDELYKDAVTELSKVCQPQFSFTLSMDNIYALPEFKEWHGNFDIGNFIHLSMDINDFYAIKLRISSLTLNPCIIENDFQIEFTNMIDYNGGRNDIAALIEEGANTTKNQISSKVKSAFDTSGIQVSDALIKSLVNNSSFTNAISSGVFDTISANKGIFNQLLAKVINAQEILANSGIFKNVEITDTGVIKSILALDIDASRISVGTLAVDRLIIRGEKNSIIYSMNNTLGAVESKEISEEEYDQYFMNGKNIQAHTITADEILANSITAVEITTENLQGINGWLNLREGTFAFYGKSDITQNVKDDQKVILAYYNNHKADNTLSDAQKKFFKLVDFDVASMNVTLTQSKTTELNPYIGNLSDVVPSIIRNNLNELLEDLHKYIIWLKVNEKIYGENGKAIETLYHMDDSALIKEFSDDDIDSTDLETIKSFIGYKYTDNKGYISWNGSKLTVNGEVYSTAGNIGGWTINQDSISRGSGFNTANSENNYNAYFGKDGLSISDKFWVDSNGVLHATDAIISGNIGANNGTFSGELVGATGSFEGKITANTGSIGGWSIWDGGITYDTDDYSVYLLNGTNANKDYLVVYDKINKNWPFYVHADGYMNATKGNIAGWNFDSKAIYKGSGFNIANTSTVVNAYFGTSGLSISDKFVVTQNGTLTATDAILENATIDGSITATSGKIGLFQISSDGSLYNKPYGTAGSGSNSCGLSVTSGKHAFWAGSGAFYVDMDGSMHCENADFVGSIVTSGEKVSTQLKNGQLSMDYNYGGIVLPKFLMGLDSNNEPFMYFYNTAAYAGVSISSSGIISKPGFWGNLDGKVLNTKGEYKIPISSSTVSGYEIDTIRSVTNSGVKKIIVYGGFGSLTNLPSDTSAVAFSSSESDSRLKKNISDTKVSNALDQILQIKHREFDWKDDNYHNDIGYVAQELEKINPRMVFKPENKKEMYSVNTFYMTGLITKSIQEMYTELTAENTALKKRIQMLEAKLN